MAFEQRQLGSERAMQVAGIAEVGATVTLLEVADPAPLADDEVLIEVRAAGVANWDDIVRAGNWDVGRSAPMALGVAAAGVIARVAPAVDTFGPGDEVLCHPVPLRQQGTWAPMLVAAASTLARKPASMAWAGAGAFPVPALTACQVIDEALAVRSGEPVLVHGAGGVTGGLLVQLAAVRGATVLATSGPGSRDRVRRLGAAEVFDYHDAAWPAEVNSAAGGRGVVAAVNAAPGGAATALTVVADGGRFATITTDPPDGERGISVSNVYVRADGTQLQEMADLCGQGRLSIDVAREYPLSRADQALADVMAAGLNGAAVLTL
jgi:NADPH:quinone reductase-like Zn-dependent oxidoreductase